YAFASHFAPDALQPAVEAYRSGFRPSEQLDRPYVIAGVNVVAADTTEAAHEQLAQMRRVRAIGLFGRGTPYSDEAADALLASAASCGWASSSAPRWPTAPACPSRCCWSSTGWCSVSSRACPCPTSRRT